MTAEAEQNEPSESTRGSKPVRAADLPSALRDGARSISRAEVQRMFEAQAAHMNEQLEARDAKISDLEQRIVAIHDHYADQADVLERCKELLEGFCVMQGIPTGEGRL